MKLQEEFSSLISDVFIFIVSHNILQNELLLSFLKDKTGFNGSCLSFLDPASLKKKDRSTANNIFLIDCKSIDMKNIWPNIPMIKKSDSCRVFFALFNVDLSKKVETTAMDNGIHGVFYEDDPLDNVPKGIRAILNGDLWYSRNTLKKILTNRHPLDDISHLERETLLTFREKEILLMIACGHNSRFISDDLCISSHTVKTHIYNIYSKINVNNRLQAALWAAKNL